MYHLYAIHARTFVFLYSKTFGNIVYYNANTEKNTISNRANAIKYVFDNYANKATTYTNFIIRYDGNFYFSYKIMRNGVTGSSDILEYSAASNEVNIWSINHSTGSASIAKTFSDDATVLAHVISPVTMNDTVDINTGYVDLNFPLNEYFFFKFVCAAGNVSSVGNLYEENMMVGFSYHVPCGKGYIRFNIESLTRINILENTSGYNFRYIKALKK